MLVVLSLTMRVVMMLPVLLLIVIEALIVSCVLCHFVDSRILSTFLPQMHIYLMMGTVMVVI